MVVRDHPEERRREWSLTLAEGVEVEHAAGAHHGLQGDDLVQRHPEQLILVEPP